MSEALLSLGADSEIHLMWVNERVRSYRKKQKVGLVRPTSSLHHLKSQRELQSIRGSETEPKFMWTHCSTCPSFSQRGAKGEHRRLRLPASPVRWFELSWLRLMPRMVRIIPTPPRQRGLLRLNAFMLTAVLHQPVETTVIQNPAFPQESSSAGVCALSHSLTQLWQMWGQSRTWVEVGRGYYDEM